MSEFAYRIKKLRGNKTMAEFGNIIDTKVATISSWENGGIIPKPDKLKDIANKLDVTLDYLLGYTNYNGTQPQETLTHIGPNRLDTRMETSPTAIVQTDETGLLVAASTTNVLVATDPRGSVETEYINPLIQLILNSKQPSNIVLDDVNSSILSNIQDTVDESDYVLKLFDADTNKSTLKINLLEYIKYKSEDDLFEIFRAYFKLNGDGDTFYWNNYFAMFLTFKYQLYRDHSNSRLSHAGFYEFLISDDNNVLENQSFDALYKNVDRYDDLKALAIETIKLFADDKFVQMMDASDVVDYSNYSLNTITIFNYGEKPTKTFNTYSAIIKHDMMVNNLHQENNIPTHWLINTSHPFHLSGIYFSIGLGRKQYITLISDAELLMETLSNDVSIFNNSSIIVNFSQNIDIKELCEKRINNRHFIRYDHKTTLPEVPYVVTSNDIYPYHLPSYAKDNETKIEHAMALLSEAMKIIEDIKKD